MLLRYFNLTALWIFAINFWLTSILSNGFLASRNFSKQHEIMCELGLILPIMKSKLDALRNRLMHQPGVKPPASTVCRELLEFTWYYLRSTDRLCSKTADTFEMSYTSKRNPTALSLTWEVIRGSWTILVNGWIPEYLVRLPQDADSLTLRLPREPERRPESSRIGLSNAELVSPVDQIRHIIGLYFALTLGTVG